MNSMTDQNAGNAGYATATSPGGTSLGDDREASSLRAELDALKSQFTHFISRAGSDAMKTAQDATSQMTDKVTDKATDFANAATQQAKTFASEIERLGRENPLGAIAGALLVGVVIGLIGRRH
jgi:ElaB/YqjD/DUF883 family membrane-anchored ribosome-binding protein